MKCCICGQKIIGYGNNPEPIYEGGRCCDLCNTQFVIPARIIQLTGRPEQAELFIAQTRDIGEAIRARA